MSLVRYTHISGRARTDVQETAVGRYGEGASIRTIASELSRSYGFVHKLLVESGTPIRARGSRPASTVTEIPGQLDLMVD